uniref:Myb-related protein 123 n=3 Tax=Gossypium raimondii TaxID=29730 RepID=A0A0D2NV60_GOSRA|nr:hypothetical protein B456_003G021100 [Gossypium raimondii]
MGRKPCCLKEGVNRGAWSVKEDQLLSNYINLHGEGQWRTLPQKAGLNRCGKSCRLRWMNYLRPGIKRGNISPDEEDLIIRLHRLLGNRWSLIAGRLPGRTDNEIKNYWNTILSKKSNADVSKKTSESEDMKSVGKYLSAGISTPVVPKATRCTKIFFSSDEVDQHLKNDQCPPLSTPTDTDDGLTLESSKDDDVPDMDNALDHVGFLQNGIADVFENSNMLESDKLAPMFETKFNNDLSSLLEFEDDWTNFL